MVRTLGAIIAGGQSRRFGSDKAAALLDGRPLIDHVAAALRPQVDRIVVVGRVWPGLASVADAPASGLGPLGGLLGALLFAAASGHDRVLTVPCDCAGLPVDLVASLGEPDAVLAAQPVIGLWSVTIAAALREWLAASPDNRAVRRWAAACGARMADAPFDLPNVNTPADLAALRRSAGPRSSR